MSPLSFVKNVNARRTFQTDPAYTAYSHSWGAKKSRSVLPRDFFRINFRTADIILSLQILFVLYSAQRDHPKFIHFHAETEEYFSLHRRSNLGKDLRDSCLDKILQVIPGKTVQAPEFHPF